VDEGAAVKRWSFSTMQAVVGLDRRRHVDRRRRVLGGRHAAAGARSRRGRRRPCATPPRSRVTAPVVEVLGATNAIVTTIIPGDDGVARRALVAGAYASASSTRLSARSSAPCRSCRTRRRS
jgi:hypothetical protein